MQPACSNLQVSTKLSTAAVLPVVTAVQKLTDFTVATFDAPAQKTVSCCNFLSAASVPHDLLDVNSMLLLASIA